MAGERRVRFRPMTRAGIDRVTDLRLELLDDLGATDPGEDLAPLRRAIRSFLERQIWSRKRRAWWAWVAWRSSSA